MTPRQTRPHSVTSTHMAAQTYGDTLHVRSSDLAEHANKGRDGRKRQSRTVAKSARCSVSLSPESSGGRNRGPLTSANAAGFGLTRP